jgi:O-antigen ligase
VAAAHFSQMQERATFRLFKLFTTDQPLSGNYSLSSRTSGRSDLAIGGFYIFEAHPMGVGTGSFKLAWKNLDRHDNMGDYARGELRAAHSGWVKVLAENGVLGILLLAAWVGSFAYGALRTRKRTLRRLGFLTSLALAAALLSTEFQSKGLWYLAAGATVFLQRDSVEGAMFVRRRLPNPGRMPRRSAVRGANV